MTSVGAWLVKNFWELIATGSLALALYFMKAWKSQISMLMNTFQAQLSSLFQDGKDTRDALATHKDAMGKATKAINGDMLRIERSVLALEKDLNAKVEVVVNETSRINRDFEMLASQFKLGVESFDARYGRLLNLEQDIKELNGKIILIDEDTKKATVLTKEHREAFTQTKKILKKMRSDIDGLTKRGSE